MEKRTILIVDDFIGIRESLKSYLEQHDFNVIVCKNGADAIEVLNTSKVNIVITDLNMPEVNGIELIKDIRKKDKKLPIIALTVESMHALKMEVKNAGANAWINKPYNLPRMLCTIEKLLPDE